VLQQTFNSRGPGTAIGAGLDGVVKINGIRRKERGHSQCYVFVTGDPGTQIYNGMVKDKAGNLWSLEQFIIPENGGIEVMATCQTPGAIFADAGTITKIVTQTNGWRGVDNHVNAMVGQPIESDPALRARQSISTAKPSKTVLLGTMGGIAEIPDVLRSKVYENDTSVFGYYGVPIPGHSICAVVEGGDERRIANEIYLRKGPGCGTYGDVEVSLESPDRTLASPPPIRFYRPQYVDVMVQVTITPRPGYVSQIAAKMARNIMDYLNDLDIGADLTVSALYVPAQAATPDIRSPLFSIQELIIGADGAGLSRGDMKIEFNQVTRGILSNINIVV
ncbi:MAG: baseplate J/gp47 family protein, partial [Oscillospiraceae bacterium]|nr:baseplate J/gp47 family protein [Oscillospiraceae bacterium]